MSQALPADAAKFLVKGDPESLYEVLVEVGQGSFGAVYKARHKRTGTAVAIKQMKRNNDDEWNDILKEIRFISSLNHDNMIKHLASYVKDGTIWMVMEFCIGSAADMIDLFRKPFAEAEIAAILHAIVPAVAYLHENKRIHRYVCLCMCGCARVCACVLNVRVPVPVT
jgi:serine/threonine protein kinase